MIEQFLLIISSKISLWNKVGGKILVYLGHFDIGLLKFIVKKIGLQFEKGPVGSRLKPFSNWPCSAKWWVELYVQIILIDTGAKGSNSCVVCFAISSLSSLLAFPRYYLVLSSNSIE